MSQPETVEERAPGEQAEERRAARLAAAAARALAEAEERRRAEKPLDLPPERGGRKGPEPVRYGDWEKNGIAVDF